VEHLIQQPDVRILPPPTNFRPVAPSDVSIIHGDCRTALAGVEPGSVDLVIADPPYGITKLEWDRDVKGWIKAIIPLMSPTASLWCFGSLKFFMLRGSEFKGLTLMQEVVWEKHNGSGPPQPGRFNRVHELVVQFRLDGTPAEKVTANNPLTFDAVARKVKRKKGPTHMGEFRESTYESVDGGPRRARSVLQFRSMHNMAKHPTQKPDDLVRMLIETSSNPGDLVLDPFGGSGTTAVTALKAGRRAVTAEKLPEFVELIRSRVEHEALSQPEFVFG
jgi:site-specific DNA-methyltransferase (adenine-specific)